MEETDIKEVYDNYYRLKHEMKTLKEQERKVSKDIQEEEIKIKEHMTVNQIDCVSMTNYQIILYEKKINQTYKKQTIKSVILESMDTIKQLTDNDRISELLTENIMNNKVFITKPEIKIKINK
jgi:hypothetical protein